MKHEPISTQREALERPVPAGREVWIVVNNPLGYKGLYLRVTKLGSRSYYFRFGMHGKQRKVFPGQLEDTYLNEAVSFPGK